MDLSLYEYFRAYPCKRNKTKGLIRSAIFEACHFSGGFVFLATSQHYSFDGNQERVGGIRLTEQHNKSTVF